MVNNPQQARQILIDYGKSHGEKASTIDKVLRNNNLGGYNPLTDVSNYSAIPGNAWRNLKELGTGLATASSEFVQPFMKASEDIYIAPRSQKLNAVKKAFADTVNNDRVKKMAMGAAIGGAAGSVIPGIGTVGGAITGGLTGLLGPENMANAILSTYGTNAKDLLSLNVNPKDVAQAIMKNPLYVGMDIAGVGGIGKSVGRGAKTLAGKSGVLQQLTPGTELSKLSREITGEKLWHRTKQGDIYSGYKLLQGKPLAKRQEIVKNIVANTGKLNSEELALAKQIKADLRAAEQKDIALGIRDADFSRDNTISQYVMSNILDDSNLLHMDIMDIIKGRPLRKTAKKMFENKSLGSKVLRLIDEGERLYDSGDIAFLTQKLANSKDPLGEVIARHSNLHEGKDYARVIGRADAKHLSNVLDDSIKQQLDTVSSTSEGVALFDSLLDNKNLGIKLSQEEKQVYKDAFRDSLRRDIENGEYPSLERALDKSAVNNILTPERYKMLEGAFDRTRNDTVATRFLNNWKKTVLGTPSWVTGNRLGNWSLNTIEGVNLKDYADIAKYEKYIPDVLRQQTSFNSYISMGSEGLGKSIPMSAFTEPLSQIRSSVGRFKNSPKSLSDMGKLAVDLIGGTSNITANPFFKIEANLEFKDRAANFIRQAKREAKATNKSVEQVLKEANTNKELFFKLNDKVNKSLGDYIGRNYGTPKTLREFTGAAIPFYRFPFQTVRTSLHAIGNRPAAFATNVTIPARAGQDLYNFYVDKYGLDPGQFKGGTPYKVLDNGTVRTVGMTPTPLSMIANRITDPSAILGMMNPVITNVHEALDYKKFDKVPSSYNYLQLKLNNPEEALKYKGNIQDRLAFAANMIGNSVYNPYMLASRFGPEAAAYVTGQGLHTPFNTNPFRENPETYKKTSGIELLGNLFGISTKGNYPNKRTKSSLKKAKNLNRYTKLNIERNK